MKKFFNDFDSFFNNDFESFFNQPIKVVGKTKTEKGQDSNGEWIKQTFTSNDGSYKVTSFVRTSGAVNTNKNNLSTQIGDLKAELESCVEKQEFEKAAELRDTSAMYEAFYYSREINNSDLEKAIKETVPLSKTMAESINALRKWANNRARNASQKF